jgi:hypothetical protein
MRSARSSAGPSSARAEAGRPPLSVEVDGAEQPNLALEAEHGVLASPEKRQQHVKLIDIHIADVFLDALVQDGLEREPAWLPEALFHP